MPRIPLQQVARRTPPTAQHFMIAFALILPGMTGCASSQGFDRTAMIEALRIDLTPGRNNQLLANQGPRLSPPFRLGVFFADQAVPTQLSIRKVEWLSADREELLRSVAPLREHGILTDAFVVTDVAVRARDLPGITQAGARYGADLVVIVDGVTSITRRNNRYAWFYPTVIGAYLAPGTESEALVMLTGSVWAVRSDWRAPLETVEGTSKLMGSAVFVEDQASLKEAKKLAIQAIGKRIVDQLQAREEERPHPIPRSP
jgi:rhombotail lipoprotein